MALETAMRMREMFTLTVGQIDLEQRTIFLDKTKNGSKRQVPISSVLLALLSEAVAGKEKSELLFAYWDGVEDMKTCSNRLSHLYKTRFSKAKVYDFHFHDCRHEATSRLYERTSMSDLEISKDYWSQGFENAGSLRKSSRIGPRIKDVVTAGRFERHLRVFATIAQTTRRTDGCVCDP